MKTLTEKRKAFYKQVHYIGRQMIKMKKENNLAFCYKTEYGNNYGSTGFAIDSILLNMSKKRLGELISCTLVNNMPSPRYWSENEFCNSNYNRPSSNIMANAVCENYLKNIKKKKSKESLKYFIGFIADRVASISSMYPKFHSFVLRKGEGLFLYSVIGIRFRPKSYQSILFNIAKRSKDSRVLNKVGDNLNFKNLKRIGNYIEEGNRTYPESFKYKISEKLLNEEPLGNFNKFINSSDDYLPNWSERFKITNDLRDSIHHIPDDKKIEYCQSLMEIKEKGLPYGSRSQAAITCINIIFHYIPHDRRLFVVNIFQDIQQRYVDLAKKLTFDKKSTWDY